MPTKLKSIKFKMPPILATCDTCGFLKERNYKPKTCSLCAGCIHDKNTKNNAICLTCLKKTYPREIIDITVSSSNEIELWRNRAGLFPKLIIASRYYFLVNVYLCDYEDKNVFLNTSMYGDGDFSQINILLDKLGDFVDGLFLHLSID